jgi:hypothetical protein
MDPWATLNAVFGQLNWERVPLRGREKESWRAVTNYRGARVVIRRRHAYASTGKYGRYSWTCVLSVDHRPRPLLLTLRKSYIGLPHVPTGDPAFDDQYRLAGSPRNVLLAAFDAQLRARLLAGFPPNVYQEDGAFHQTLDDVVEGHRGNPEMVAHLADLLLEVNARICAEFDRAHAAIAAQQGTQAAEMWLQAQRGEGSSALERRRKFIILILAGVALVVVVLIITASVLISWL